MKKDLFDHIIINGANIEFGSYRKMTKIEGLTSTLLGNVYVCFDKIYVIPKTFKEFLRCLEKTKITKNLDFRIAEQFGKKFYEISFNDMLNYFVECKCKKHSATQKQLIAFYSIANKIKEEKIKEQQILNSIPKQYIK